LTENLQFELREALYDFQRYLLDQIPPLTAGDAIETLMRQPAELFIRHTHAWAVEQSRVQPMAISDFMFHALKKVYLCSTLSVVDPAAVDDFLERAIPLALQICPAAERDTLLSHLNAMRSSQSLRVAPVHVNTLKETAGGQEPVAPPPEAPKDSIVARSARRFSLVVDRLARMLPGAAPSTSGETEGQPLQPVAPTAAMVTMAAASSTSSRELESYLESLRPYTGDSQENLFRILARGIPGWELMPTADAGPAPAAPLEAMHKIMKLTDDSLESTRRFRELLNAGIERFNAGSLGAAVSIFELAETVIEEKKLDPSTIDRIRIDLAETISPEQLKQYGEHKAKYPLLRKALAFFPPLQLENLLQELRVEERPERRRSILGLLEAYGPQAREAAVAELPVELDRPAEEIAPYYLRNLIYLMHRIPRPDDAPVVAEIELLTRASMRGQSIYVIKEAMLPLGQIRSEAAVRLLTMRLAEAEAALLRSDTLYPVDEMHKLVDRIISVLGRIGTPAALLTIARHGMKPNPLLGDTRSRLSALSQHDLSFDEQTVTLLVNTIREDLSGNLLGRLLRKRQAPPLRLIEALSSTRSHLVESLFEEIAARFPDDEAGKAATAALENLAAAARRETTTEGVATLTGDLQFFGLPALLQSLRDTQATGIVTLSGKEAGNTAGKLLLLEGEFLDAQAAHLRGVDALYQLLERPVVGTFIFVSQPPAKVRTSRNSPKDLMALIFEGIRRHDELNQAAALAPDDLVTRPTAVRPTAATDEVDSAVVRDMWVKATSGKPIHEWEPHILVDAYRIRRQIAHWLEEGALQPVEE
jgi:hypothetical protein